MSKKLSHFGFFVSWWIVCVVSQDPPLSPCPRVFSYDNDGQMWFGVVVVQSPKIGTSLKLNLRMEISRRLPTRYIGRIELLGARADIVQSILNNGKLKYKVHFPVLDAFPAIISIIFNGKEICIGSHTKSAYVTTIGLQHVLNTNPHESHKQNIPLESPLFQDENYEESTSRPESTIPSNNYEESTSRPESTIPSNNYYLSSNPYFQRINDNPSVNKNMNTEIPPAKLSNNRFANRNKQNIIKNKINHEIPNPDSFAFSTLKNQSGSSNKGNKKTRLTSNEKEEVIIKCGKSKKESNALVIGGETTSKGEWPWLAALFVKKITGLDFTCAGTLISKYFVLTAAHCLVTKNNRPVKKEEIVLKLGIFNIQDWTDADTKTLEVDEVILPPDFEGGLVLKNDIAILKITAVNFTNYIIPACLWPKNLDTDSFVGKFGTIVGWGRDEYGLLATPEPRLTRQKLVSTEQCRASRPEFFYLTSNTTVCAGGKDGTGPCNGDSGGGLFLNMDEKWFLRGIVSNSLKDPNSATVCDLYEFVVFTDVAKYTEWLENFM